MELSFKKIGSGYPLVLLHGLFGSGDNWQTLAGKMKGFEVWLPDFRNHGNSPWSEEFSIPLLAADVKELIQTQGLGKPVLAGHSLGGKVAMELALDSPDLARALVILDMAPRAYEPKYPRFVPLMRDIDLPHIQGRKEAQDFLEKEVDRPTVMFLLKNLVSEEGKWRWKLNLEALAQNYHEIWKPLQKNRTWPGPALFIRGGNSDYVRDEDRALVGDLFPQATVATVADAGHWLHAEKPQEVLGLMGNWLTSVGLDHEPWT